MPSFPFYSSSLLVLLGGGAGAVLRLWLSMAMLPLQRAGGFPYATFVANTVGSLLMGVLIGWLARQGGESANQAMLLLIGVGLLGGFTTFSSFSLEIVRLVEGGAVGTAVIYAALSLAVGIGALFLGLTVARSA